MLFRRSHAIGIKIAALLIFSLTTAGSSEAIELDWQNLLETGERCSGLSREIILSVMWIESRGNPNAININGVGGFSPVSAEEALRILYRYNRPNVDIGLMQVNWKTWGPLYGLRAADLLDPATNICLGSRILRDYIDDHRGSWRGVGRYNAVTYSKQLSYATQVNRTYKRIKAMHPVKAAQ